jgi:filamentous hemagglutinin family protein
MKMTRRRRGLPNLRTLVAALNGSQTWVFGLASVPMLLSPAAWAQSIQTDGRTATSVTTAGAVTDIRTSTVSGNAGFNSFKTFSVNAGQTANLHVPDGALHLVNIVRDSRTDINGTLNAIRDGRIGGSVYFANPHGFVVGAGGVVNVGSLTAMTPTQQFVDNFFAAPGVPNADALGQLMDGTVPLTESGLVRVEGRINAQDGVSIRAGNVQVSGSVLTGARFEARTPDFTDVVNAQGLEVGTRVVERAGRIFIAATRDIEVSGELDARGGAGVDGGGVTLRAGRDIVADIDSMVTAAGDGENSDGGRIDSLAQRNAVFRSGAVMDASAGASGDGGFIEFSAKDTVELAGGEFVADGRDGGAAGKVLIDPVNIVLSQNLVRGAGSYAELVPGTTVSGANLLLQADRKITVSENVIVSSRRVASDHVGGDSIEASGDITFEAADIELKSGSKVLAHGTGNIAGGTVTLTAHKTSDASILGYREASASIVLDNATVRGDQVTMSASTDVQNRWLFDDGSLEQNATSLATESATALLGFGATLLGMNIVHSQAVGTATITLKAGSLVEGTNGVSLSADNVTSAGAAPDTGISGPGTQVNTPLGLGALYARNTSTATVDVKSGATVRGASLTVRANNTATIEAAVEAADPGEDASSTMSFALGLTYADIRANATVEAGADIQVSGDVTVAATNRNSFTNSVTASLGNEGRAAAAIAVSELSTQANATLNADVGDATRVQVLAINDNTKNATTAEAKVGGTLNEQISDAVKDRLKPVTDTAGTLENKLWDKLLGGAGTDDKAADPERPVSTPLRIGGGIAWVDSDASASAAIGDGAKVHAGDQVAVVARTLGADIQVMAEASAISQSRERAAANTARNTFSAGIAIGNFTHDARATIGRAAVVTAPRIAVASDVVIPVRETLLTGGSFTRWDGLSTVKDWFNDLTGILDVFNGASSAKSTSDNSNGAISLSGSFSKLDFSHSAQTEVKEGARLNLTGNASGDWTYDFETVADDAATPDDEQVTQSWAFAAPADITARRDVTLMFHGGQFLPGDTGAGNGGKSLGVAYTQEGITGESLVFVREGAVIQGVTESVTGAVAGQRSHAVTGTRLGNAIRIKAEGHDLVISLAALAGYGSSFGINGSVSIVEVDNTTRALVDDEATLRAAKLTVGAEDNPVLWSIAGGFNKSESAGVGVGIAYNGVTGMVEAQIADNDLEAIDGGARSSQLTIADAIVQAGNVSVEARTSGRTEAIAVTGALATSSGNSSSGGFFGSIKSKYDAVQGKLAKLVDIKPTSTSQQGGTGAQGTPAKPTFGLSGAGSAAVNEMTLVTRARVAGVELDQGNAGPASTLTVLGVSDLDIVTASGAAAFTRANNPGQSKSAAISGSVSVNLIDNMVEGLIEDSTLRNTQDVTVQALAAGEQLSVAIGVAIDASNQQSKSKSVSATGSLSLSFIDNAVRAALLGTELTGAAGAGRTLDVTGYNRMFIGTGGGTLAVGAKTGAGGAVTYSDITNTLGAEIGDGSAVSGVDTVNVRGFNATEIGAGAAHAQASNAQNSNALGGAVVITEVTNRTTAGITGLSSVTATGAVNVLAQDRGAEAALEDTIEPGNKRENTVAGLDYCGRGGAGATPAGNCITSVAGILQVNPAGGSSNIGASFNWSSIDNDLTAKVEDSKVDVTGAAGALTVRAQSDVLITSIALGVGVADKVSGVGSVAVNFIDNDLVAAVAAPQANAAFRDADAAQVTIEATDGSRIDTLAGGFAASKNGPAVGAAITYAEIGNTVQAQIDRARLDAAGSLNLLSVSDARIRSLAVAGGLAVGSGQPAVSASIAVNFIGNTTESTVDDALIDDSGDGNSVTVSAQDRSTIQSLAGSVAVGASAGAGGAFGYNKIGNSTRASIGNSTVRHADALQVTASETALMQTLALAASGGQTAALSGSVTLNHIGKYDGDSTAGGEGGNRTTAEIVGSTIENADGNAVVGVTATDGSTIESLSGAVAFSGSTAVGGAIGDNWVRNTAQARVDGSTVSGAASLTLLGSNTSLIKAASVAGAGGSAGAFAGSASSNRTDNKTLAGITGSDVTGGAAAVGVRAADSAIIKSLAGGVGISASAGVGAAVAVNKIANTTAATISGVRSTGMNVANVLLVADSLANIETAAVGVGAGLDVGVGGSVAVNLINSDTRAVVEDGAVIEARDNVGVLAESDDEISLLAGAAGIGISAAGVGAAVTVNDIGGTTEAAIRDSSVAARAKQGAALSVNSGEITGLNLRESIDTMNTAGGGYSKDNPFDAPDLKNSRVKESVRGIAVNAMATHQTTTGVANVGGGTFAGVAATISMNMIGGETKATVSNSVLNGGDNSGAGSAQAVSIKASDHAYGNTFIGSIAVGAAGVGLSADTNLFERSTSATVSGATTVTARGKADVKARSSQGVASIVVGAAGGLVGLVGSGSVAKFVSTTEASSIGSTFRVGALDIGARHDSAFLVAGGALAVGGGAGAGTFAVGLDTSTTKGYIDGGSVDADGQVNVTADSATEMRTWAVGGALAGGSGVAGAAAVGILDSTTSAYVKDARVGSLADRSGGLRVAASDSVVTESRAGVAAVGGFSGAGAGASITKMDNTTSATIQDSDVHVDNDVVVQATATRNLANAAVAAAAGGTAGIGGAAAVTLLNAGLNGDASGEVDKDGNGTLSKADGFSNGNRLSTSSSDGNISTNDNLSQSDINSINARGRVSASGGIAAAPDGSTRATIVDTGGAANTVRAGGSIRITASENDKVDVKVGGLALGGLAGVGAAVGVLDVRHDVRARTDGAITLRADAGDIELNASTGRLDAGTAAVNVSSFQAAGGLVGVGAAVATADLGNTVEAKLGDGTQASVGSATGDVRVIAADNMDASSHAEGYSVGLVAAGIVIARAEKTGSTTAAVGESGAAAAAGSVTLAGGDFAIDASRQDAVSAYSRAGSGGVAGGSGSEATATATGSANAGIADRVTVTAPGSTVTVASRSTPQVNAEARGFNGALTVAIGVSLARATSGTQSYATLGSNNRITAGNLSLSAATLLPGAADTAHAYANATGGALLGGANGSSATAAGQSLVNAVIGASNVFTVSDSTTVSASNRTRQSAQVSGVTLGGLLAVGANIANANAGSVTLADIANGNTGTVGDALSVVATGHDETYATAKAGSGGLVAGAVAEARTRNASDTQALLGGGTAASALGTDAGGKMEVRADHTATFDSTVDSVSAGAVGASGAVARSDVDAKVVAGVRAGANLLSRDMDVLALNRSLKPLLSGFNVSAGAGGLAGGAAGSSRTTVDNITLVEIGDGAVVRVVGDPDAAGRSSFNAVSEVDLHDRAKLEAGGAISAADAESIIEVNANPIAPGQGGRTQARVGNNVVIDTVGDFNLAARDAGDVSVSANSKTWGLAAYADGYSASDLRSRTSAEVGSGTDIRADGFINVGAGRDADGVRNRFSSVARADLYNNSLVPISSDDWGADALLNQTATIRIDGSLRSVKDVNLTADKGFGHRVDGQGVAKDLYDQAASAVASGVSNLFGGGDVSIESNSGRSIENSSSGVTVSGLVDAGIQNQQLMTINESGSGAPTLTVSVQVPRDGQDAKCRTPGTAGCTYDTVSKSYWITRSDGMDLPTLTVENLQGNLRTRINALKEIRGNYTGTSSTGGDASNPETVAALTAEINFLELQMEDLFPGGGANASVSNAAFIVMPEVDARGGNINVIGDSLAGNGRLNARGEAKIEIINNTSSFLRTDALTIPEDATGRLTLNGVAILNVAGTNPTTAQINGALNDRNQGGSANFADVKIAPNSPAPSITVRNTFVPADGDTRAPDIEVVGDISNMLGVVTLESERGSVLVQPKDPLNPLTAPNIQAATINITAGRDFVFSSPSAFYHTAGNPRDMWGGTRTPSGNSGGLANDFEDGGSGSGSTTQQRDGTGGPTIAGNNIFISARYLNINGLLQSGLPDRSIIVGNDATVTLEVGSSRVDTTLALAKSTYDTLVASSGQKPADPRFRIRDTSGNIVAFFNAELDRIELEPVKVEGGKLELVGEILNTGGGRIEAMDGYGRFDIDNTTGKDLVITGLDTGNDIEGRIRITDFLRRWDPRANGGAGGIVTSPGQASTKTTAYYNSLAPVTREITRLGTDVVTKDKLGDIVLANTTVTTANTRNSAYAPVTGQTYTWVTGQRNTTNTYEKYEKETKFWFFDGNWSLEDRTDHKTWDDPTPLSEGEYTKIDTGMGDTTYRYQRRDVTTSFNDWEVNDSECSAFLCIWKWHTHEVWTETGAKRYNTHTVKGDYSIPVKFIGYDSGQIDVRSGGGIIVNGGVTNRTGTVTMDSTAGRGQAGGAIDSESVRGVISAPSVVLRAATGIGSTLTPLQLDMLGGTVTALTATGDVGLREVSGDMRVAGVRTDSDGRVFLQADRDIVAAGAGNTVRVSGGGVDLVASSGQIGSASQALVVQTEASVQGGINALANGDINLMQPDGDMQLEKVESLTGDVTLTAGNGRITDGNRNETRDTRAEGDLDQLWSDLRLRESDGAGDSLDEALAAHKAQIERDYREYWSLRNVQLTEDANNPGGYVYRADAYDAATASQRLRTLHDELGGLGVALATGTASDYSATFSYDTVAAGDTMAAGIADGTHVWSDNQVRYGVSAAIYNKSTPDTETRIEQPNIVGRHIVLNATGANGGVGRDEGQFTVDISSLATLSAEQRRILSAAEADDVAIDAVAKTATVLKRDDVDIATSAGGSVTVNARGHVFLGADDYERNGTVFPGDINLVSLDATGGGIDYSKTIRLKVSGGIVDAGIGAAPNLRGGDTILESGQGAIGSAARPISIDLGDSALLTARAASGIWLNELSGTMRVAEMFAGSGGIHLVSAGSILDARGTQRAVALQSADGDIDLRSLSGSVGAAGQAMFVSLGDGSAVNVNAADEAHLSGTAAVEIGLSPDLATGTVSAGGNVSLAAPAGTLHLGGDVSSGGSVALRADGDLVQDAAQVSATNDISVDAGRYLMADGAVLRAQDGTIAIDAAGDVVVGRIEASNNATADAIRITTGSRILDGGDAGTYDLVAATAGAGVRLDASGGAGGASWNGGAPGAPADALETDIAKIDAISTAGGLNIDERDDVEIGSVEALRDVRIAAAGSINKGTVHSRLGNIDLLADGKVTVLEATADAGSTTVIAESDIIMDAVTAGNGVTLESVNGSVSVSRITGDILSLSAKNDLNLGTLSVGRSLTFNSNSVSARIVHTRDDAALAMRATGRNGAPATWVNLAINSAVGVHFDRFDALDAKVHMERGWLRIDEGRIGNRARFSNPVTDVYMDNLTTVVLPADVQLHHPGKRFNDMYLDQWLLVTDPYVVMRDPLHEVVMNNVLDFSGREQSRELIVTRVDTPDRQSAEGQVPQLPSLAINIPLDIPAVNSGEEETEEEAEARRKAEEEEAVQ